MVKLQKIVIDARMYGLEHAGIGRYVMSLISNLELPSAFKLILLVKKEKMSEIKRELGNKFEYIPVKSRHYSFVEQLEIPLILNKIKPDLVHFPHFNSSLFWQGDFVVTIHDLIKHYFTGKETTTRSTPTYWLKHLAYRFQINYSVKKSKLIIVPSQYWKKELVKKFKVPQKKIIVTHEAVDPDFLKLVGKKRKSVLKKFSLKTPFFIYTGNVYPHKNIERLLRAIRKINNVNLVIVCSRGVFTKRLSFLVNKLRLKKRVDFLGFVNDRDLISLYQKAEALVQPSLMEGFGLTGLEAMAAGCSVVSSNASCLPEIYGEAALYFDPLNITDIAEKLELILKNKKLREELAKKGKKQVEKYSWMETARTTVEGYKKILTNN